MNQKNRAFVLTTPKSGTFLWQSLMPSLGYESCGFQTGTYNALPEVEDFHGFYKDPSSHNINQTIDQSLVKIGNGQFGYGHIPFLPKIEREFRDAGYTVFLQSRDLRDSICSMMRYESKFAINKDKIWSQADEDPQRRLIYFLDQNGLSFRHLVAPMIGWLESNASSSICHINWQALHDGDVPEQLLTALNTDKRAFQLALKSAKGVDTVTKSQSMTSYQKYWSEQSELLFRKLGLADLNKRFGYEILPLGNESSPQLVDPKGDALTQAPKQAPRLVPGSTQKRMLVVVNAFTTQAKYSIEMFEMLARTPGCEVDFTTVQLQGQPNQSFDFSNYHAICLTPHIRPWLKGWDNPGLEAEIYRFQGLKLLFLHDEYDQSGRLKDWIKDYGIQSVFSVVPEKYLATAYPPAEFPDTEFQSILTYYLPSTNLENGNYSVLHERHIDIFYRGRLAKPAHGELGRQKYQIGETMLERATELNLIVDISNQPKDRLAGTLFRQRLGNAKATLATEWDSNVFDVDGRIRDWFEAHPGSKPPPELNSIEENIGVRMNQISPKMFEAIALGTALVMYEGEYSEILEADKHYISLKIDHSNIDEVFEKLADIDALQTMVDRSYLDIVASNKYSEDVLHQKINQVLTSQIEHTPALNNAQYLDIQALIQQLRHSHLARMESQITLQTRSLDNHRVANNKLNTAKQKLVERNTKLKDANQNLRVVNERLKSTIENHKNRNQNLRVVNERLKNTIENHKNRNQVLEENLVVLKNKNHEINEQRNLIHKRRNELLELNKRLIEEKTALFNELEKSSIKGIAGKIKKNLFGKEDKPQP